MREKIVKLTAKVLGLPEPYFELNSVEPDEFNTLSRGVVAVPTMMNWEKMAEAMWPRPYRTFRVFIKLS